MNIFESQKAIINDFDKDKVKGAVGMEHIWIAR